MKYLIFFSFIFLLSACSENDASTPDLGLGSSFPSRLTISGVNNHGIFDASLAQVDASKLWMTYSHVLTSTMWPSQNGLVVATRLGFSNDNGESWTDAGEVNSFLDVVIPLAPPLNAGTWVNEVSSLVYDAGATPTERWKLIWHHYLTINSDRRFEHGWIGLKMASSPEGLATATEIKLFGGAGYDTANNSLGGPTSSPVGGAPAVQLDTAIHAALNNCLFSEPSLYSNSGALYLSLLCKQLATPNDSLIVLLKCVNPCNMAQASSWSYLGTLLNNSDASAAGFNGGYSAPQLVESGGKSYLIATPVENPGDLYRGCRVFRFADLESGVLERTGGIPNIVTQVNGTSGSFNGACTYHSSSSGSGVIYSEINPSETEVFRLFRSGVQF